MNNKVAIIGLGPTGSFAAKAAYDQGCEVDIFATQTPAVPPGAFWLHWIPQDVTKKFKPEEILITASGNARDYVMRQWQGNYPSSFPENDMTEEGYNPADILPNLVPAECTLNLISTPLSDEDVADLASGYGLVFQTFATKESKQQQPALVPYCAAAKFGTNHDTNIVWYNGTKRGLFVRTARLFGNDFVEFPKRMELPEVTEIMKRSGMTGYDVTVLKDIDPRTKPWQSPDTNIKLLGRFAEWDRSVLSHDAYNKVTKYIKEFRRGK